jgi:hypothetical protein
MSLIVQIEKGSLVQPRDEFASPPPARSRKHDEDSDGSQS